MAEYIAVTWLNFIQGRQKVHDVYDCLDIKFYIFSFIVLC